jgi:hypothetical protein
LKTVKKFIVKPSVGWDCYINCICLTVYKLGLYKRVRVPNSTLMWVGGRGKGKWKVVVVVVATFSILSMWPSLVLNCIFGFLIGSSALEGTDFTYM